jgi:ParB family chromosome partitioning protein
MRSRKVLGRGLDALIPQGPPAGEDGDESVHRISVEDIVPNPRQPRSEVNDAGLRELAESIRERGVLEPLIVRPLDDGRYELVAGERRLRASALAGKTEVPVLFRDFGGVTSLEIALIENLQREDLNPVDEARAYQKLVDEFGRTHAEISKAVGKDRSTVSNLLRILRLPPPILESVSRGTLSVGHARALLNVQPEALQVELAERMVAEAWSVREAERSAIQLASESGESSRPTERRQDPRTRPKDPQVARVEEAIRTALGTDVRLSHGPKGGTIHIRYFSDEELERLLQLMRVEVY